MGDYWLVLRQDDNGNVFVVGEHSSKELAQQAALKLASRAHKQMYWIEPRGEVPRFA